MWVKCNVEIGVQTSLFPNGCFPYHFVSQSQYVAFSFSPSLSWLSPHFFFIFLFSTCGGRVPQFRHIVGFKVASRAPAPPARDSETLAVAGTEATWIGPHLADLCRSFKLMLFGMHGVEEELLLVAESGRRPSGAAS